MAEHAERYWEARWRDEAAANDRLNMDIEKLREEIAALHAAADELRDAVAEWKERWQAERDDHERTIKHFDRMWDQGP